jgi:branched-chain amino acid aminotransferase
MIEAFGCGTAALCSPISGFNYKGKEYEIPVDEKLQAGKLCKELTDTLQDIQFGRVEHPWSHKIIQ